MDNETTNRVIAANIPKPDVKPTARFVTVQEGVNANYSKYAINDLPVSGVRVVHPTNPNAPSVHHGVSMLYLLPKAGIGLHSHPTEETYCILSGTGIFEYEGGSREVGPGDFAYLPSWCEHGLINTGREMMVALLTTAPPNK